MRRITIKAVQSRERDVEMRRCVMKWIWTKQESTPGFAEFKLPLEYKSGKAVLKISAEYRYVAYVNGAFAANGQYPDMPWYKVYDEIDITRFLKAGENELLVQAFHMGLDAQVAYADAGT